MIFIFGAGRQGRIVYSILKLQLTDKSCLFANDFKTGKCSGISIKKISHINLNNSDYKILAIGNDMYTHYDEKVAIAKRLSSLPGRFKAVIGGFISGDVEIPDTLITHPGSIVMTGTKLGEFVIISTNSSIDHDNIIEDFVNIAPGVVTGGDVRIGKGAFIGMGAVIFPNVKIGKKCIIGAGSLVRHDIPDGMLAYGSPARIIKKTDK